MPVLARIALVALLTVTLAATAKADLINFSGLSFPNPLPDPLPSGSTGQYDNGVDLNGGFTAQGAYFTNSYGTYVNGSGQTVDYFGGWAYSNVKDTVTSTSSNDPNDYHHEFAAITQAAPAGSVNYGIDQVGDPTSDYINLPNGKAPISFQVTNTVYDYLAMTQGDGFIKTPFVTGDFLSLTINGYSGLGATGSLLGSITVYLANYSTDSDLPLTTWMTVDLSGLNASGTVASLGFTMASSRNNEFGSIVPSLFAMDNLIVSPVPEPSSIALVTIGLGVGLIARRWVRRA